jgi:hypothetical protein
MRWSSSVISAAPRLLSTLVIVLLASVAACDRITPSGFSGDVDALLSRGGAFADGLVSSPPQRLTDEEVVALGYLERARLGLGSPFRLIDFILADPSLSEGTREALAYGVLARALDGRTYFVDPKVMDVARLAGIPAGGSTGYEQLRLLERAIASAPTPTAGERTVRLGYLLAESERTIQPGYATVVAHVAAMLADRRRAREDASLLLRTATRTGSDPLLLLRGWRQNGRFQVERPSLASISVRDEEAEARDGPNLAVALRTLAQRQSGPVSLAGEATRAPLRDEEPLLGLVASERLRSLAEARRYPPQAPIAVAVEINRDGLISRPGLSPEQKKAREEFADGSWSEERLVAHAATLRALGADAGQRPPLVMLQAATFLRVWNQEEPWFPGDAAPSARDVEARFGLAAIQFQAEVDDAWRGYYLRMLGRSLADLQRVLPTVSMRGLTIVVGDLPRDTRALALHEPRSRTLFLPPRTGAGTIAHELAHDLDWQLARRRYGTRGGYATDLAVRDNRGDRIAAAMMGLSASLVQPTADQSASAHATRPAEVFARGIDWLVAAMLAGEGKLGGYLTSFQDPVLTGYGTTRGPDITGGAVLALLSILDAVAPVVEPTRNWALETYGPSRTLTGMELTRVVTEAGLGLSPDQRLQRIEEIAARSFEAIDDCRFGSLDGVRRLVAAQRRLAEESLRAAARGAAVDGIHSLASEHRGPEFQPVVDAWLAWRLYGAPEPVDSALVELAPAFEDLLLHASFAERRGAVSPGTNAFHTGGTPSLCGGNPFAAETPVGRFRGSVGPTPS